MRTHLLLAFSIVLAACSRIPGGTSASTAQPPPAAASSGGDEGTAGVPAQPTSQPASEPQTAAATSPVAETAAPSVKLGAFRVLGATSGTRLRLADLDKLTVESAYTAPAGKHTQRVEVTDPHGLLYGSLQAQVAAGADGAVSNQQALQVAGTTIERFRMVGTWQFVLSVDGTPLASTSADIVE